VPRRLESDEFRALFDRYFRVVHTYVARRVRADEDVDEIAIAVFEVAWAKFEQIPIEPHTRQWLLLVARHKIANHSRGAARWGRLIERLTSYRAVAPIELDELGTEDDVALRAFGRLSAAHREVLALIAWDGLSYAEAAAVLRCSTDAFGVRLFRARAAYRDAFELENRRGSPAASMPNGDAPRRHRLRRREHVRGGADD